MRDQWTRHGRFEERKERRKGRIQKTTWSAGHTNRQSLWIVCILSQETWFVIAFYAATAQSNCRPPKEEPQPLWTMSLLRAASEEKGFRFA